MRTGPLRRLAAVAACLAAIAGHAAELGTLFTTPQERDRLDRLRRGEPDVPQASHEHPRNPVVTGFVKRSDGRNTVWIDGVPMVVGRKNAEALLQPGAVESTTSATPRLRVERDDKR